ncbi:hypothetical protein GOODEAATRI_009304 [Goodea atripinnis]|uniref:Uncharacterized protein n=1 Tax=Goodea atripinnis TaxID=208336 RepID=A0ABV0PM73_9TELE
MPRIKEGSHMLLLVSVNGSFECRPMKLQLKLITPHISAAITIWERYRNRTMNIQAFFRMNMTHLQPSCRHGNRADTAVN